MSNITVGPALEIGGNTVEMTTKGKVQVTNSKGRIKTLSQDEFKKNLIKNADKINEGEDFEFKKEHKGLKIAAAAVMTAAVVTSAIYHKEIGKYMKDFSFKKLWKDIKGLFKSVKEKLFGKKKTPMRSVLNGEKTVQKNNNLDADITARETLNLKNNTAAMTADYDAKNFEKHIQLINDNHEANALKYESMKDTPVTSAKEYEQFRSYLRDKNPKPWYVH